MEEISSKKDIEKISKEILKSSKALDVFPTPIDKIVSYSDLVVAQGIDLSKIDHGLLSRITDTVNYSVNSLKSGLEKIRGILDREEKIIYLDLSQPNTRQGFVKLHEVGHNVLTWQDQILKCLDDDDTLNPSINEEFEAEANYFASITLFQGDRFINEMNKLPLEIGSAMHLAKLFGGSNHAAFRRYVECTKKRCALLVLENVSSKGEAPICSVRNYFQSVNFTKHFGEIQWNPQLGYSWLFVQDYYQKRRFLTNRVIGLATSEGVVEFNYHFFNNTYNAFVFLFPKGESNKSRIKFSITK